MMASEKAFCALEVSMKACAKAGAYALCVCRLCADAKKPGVIFSWRNLCSILSNSLIMSIEKLCMLAIFLCSWIFQTENSAEIFCIPVIFWNVFSFIIVGHSTRSDDILPVALRLITVSLSAFITCFSLRVVIYRWNNNILRRHSVGQLQTCVVFARFIISSGQFIYRQ